VLVHVTATFTGSTHLLNYKAKLK